MSIEALYIYKTLGTMLKPKYISLKKSWQKVIHFLEMLLSICVKGFYTIYGSVINGTFGSFGFLLFFLNHSGKHCNEEWTCSNVWINDSWMVIHNNPLSFKHYFLKDDVTCDITMLTKKPPSLEFLQSWFVHSLMEENIQSYILWILHYPFLINFW